MLAVGCWRNIDNVLQVLHATRDIDRTLMNVKSLIKPCVNLNILDHFPGLIFCIYRGGKLVLGELTRVLMKDQVIFGTLPGWWLGKLLPFMSSYSSF